MNEYRVGGRYLHAKTRHPLTVRYIGTLPPLPAPPSAGPSGVTASASSSQFWLGVEYDDPSHGRGHSGTFEGIGVFCTGQDGAGAFVKLAPGVLSPGRTLASAVEERYGAIIPNNEPFVEKGGLSTEDSVQLGTSKIVVEAPGMEAVRKKIGRLEKLREVGLEGEWIGSLGGDPDTNKRMRERLKGVTLINLSSNLISSVVALAKVLAVFEGVTALILNHSRIRWNDADDSESALPLRQITQLYLGYAGVSWEDVSKIGTVFPSLTALHLNNNAMLHKAPSTDFGGFTNLKHLSLASCALDDWLDIVRVSTGAVNLESLDLSGIPLTTIPPQEIGDRAALPGLKAVVLSNTSIKEWSSIDNLASWCPNLSSLRITSSSSDPVPTEDAEQSRVSKPLTPYITGDDRFDRPIFIAKIASLQVLNSTTIKSDERRDTEMAYVKEVSQMLASTQSSEAVWGRYAELKTLHGISEAVKPSLMNGSSSLRAKMIRLSIIHAHEDCFDLSVLPSASVLLLKRKIAKKVDRDLSRLRLWTVQPDNNEKLHEVAEGRNVEWWFSDGDRVLWTTRGLPKA